MFYDILNIANYNKEGIMSSKILSAAVIFSAPFNIPLPSALAKLSPVKESNTHVIIILAIIEAFTVIFNTFKSK